jgi:hypothetical protein
LSALPRFTGIRLPLNRAACEPSKPCAVASKCARHRAALHPNHTTRDFFEKEQAGSFLCPGFMTLTDPRLEKLR